jgi:hypothetical protein
MFMLRAVNKHTDTDYFPFLLPNQVKYFPYGLSGSENIIDNKHFFSRLYPKPAFECPLITVFFSKEAPDSELPADFMGKNNAARSGTGYNFNIIIGKMAADKATKLLGITGMLQNMEFLPVDR